MQARPGPAWRPESWVRGYSRPQVRAHLEEVLELYAELDATYEAEHDSAGIPPELRAPVFAVVQAMVAAVEPAEGASPRSSGKLEVAAGGSEIDRLLRKG